MVLKFQFGTSKEGKCGIDILQMKCRKVGWAFQPNNKR